MGKLGDAGIPPPGQGCVHSHFIQGMPSVALMLGIPDISGVDASRESGAGSEECFLGNEPSSIPKDCPLGCLLTHWKQFRLPDLRGGRKIHFLL